MKTFSDNSGRIWTVVVTVATLKRVRALCEIDLYSIVEVDEKNNLKTDLLDRLSSDPVLLVDVLYAVCKPEADKLGVTDEQFGESMAGDAIAKASEALLDEIVDFFPDPKRGALRKILTVARRFGALTEKKLAEINEEKMLSDLEKQFASSTDAPESAG